MDALPSQETLILYGILAFCLLWLVLLMNDWFDRSVNGSGRLARWFRTGQDVRSRKLRRTNELTCAKHELPIRYCPLCELEARIRIEAELKNEANKNESELPLAEEIPTEETKP